MTSTASTRSSARSSCSALRYSSGPADATMSTGFATLAASGRKARSAATVSSPRVGSSRPFASQASAARMPGPPALVRMATRGPFGGGWCESRTPTSNSSSNVLVRMTPAWRKSASTMVSLAASAPVCDEAARWPARDRPDLTTTIGLSRPTRRAISLNLRGLPKLSRYSRMTAVFGSSAQYWMRSLPETSALFPADTNVEIPRFSRLT